MQEKKNARTVYNVLPTATQKAEGVDYTALLSVVGELFSLDESAKDKARNSIISGTLAIVKGKGKSTGCAILLDKMINLTGHSLESQARSFASRCGVKYQKDEAGKYHVIEWKQPVDENGNPVDEDKLEDYLGKLSWKKEGGKSKDTEVKPIASNGAGLKYFMNEKKASLLKALKGRNDGSIKSLIEKLADDEAFCDKVLGLLNDYNADSNKGLFSRIFG